MSIPLAVTGQIVSGSGVAEATGLMLPAGVRGRQLKAGTLLTGMMLALAGGRPAHLTRLLEALTGLPEDDQKRPGVIAQRKKGPHQLTCRQAGHTHRLIGKALARETPDGAPAADQQRSCDQLPGASIPAEFKDASTSLAADQPDAGARARAVPASSPGTGADPEARRGHRNASRATGEGEMFSGYYMPAATMATGEDGPVVPELVRRITVCSSAHDPAAALVPVLPGMAASGARPGDILAGSGFSHRAPGTRANPLRGIGAQLAVRSAPARPRPAGNPRGRGHLQRQPILPADAEAAAAADPAAAGRQRCRGRRARPADRRAVALQARAARRRGPRRAPAARLPRGHGEDPLPPPARAGEAGARPARDPRPAREPAGLLHPENPSPPGPASPRKPGKNATTPQRRTGAPAGGAPPASGSTPASRTPPPARPAAAGSGSRASPR